MRGSVGRATQGVEHERAREGRGGALSGGGGGAGCGQCSSRRRLDLFCAAEEAPRGEAEDKEQRRGHVRQVPLPDNGKRRVRVSVCVGI